jgi:hypothetical protein
VDANVAELSPVGWFNQAEEAYRMGRHRPLFTEALHVYRLAFEAAEEGEDDGVRRVRGLMAMLLAKGTRFKSLIVATYT